MINYFNAVSKGLNVLANIQMKRNVIPRSLFFVKIILFSEKSIVSLENTIQKKEEDTNLIETDQSPKLPTQNHFEIYPIEKYQVGQRLDRFLRNTKLNWALAQKFLRNRHIFIMNKQGQKVKNNDYRLQQGDFMHVKNNVVPLLHQQKPLPANCVTYEYAKSKLDKATIFDNKNLTILNKPASYSVQGGDQVDRNLFSLMSARYKKQYVYVIHRLDKPTTGVLFFCKNLRTAQLIQAAIESRTQYNKYYLALAVGDNLTHKEEYIRCNIEWTKKHKARMIQSLQKEDSKDCITYYKKLHSVQLNTEGKNINLLGMKLITGRKHQIRCHLSDFLNNPILNDKRYGAVLLKNTPTKDLQEPFDKQQRKQDDESIFLHALMTTITNPQIATDVFEIPEHKIRHSKNSTSSEIISNNQNGAVLLKNGEVKIIANLPNIWKKLNQGQQSTNFPLIKSISFEYEFDEIQIAQEIQRSEINLWRKHRPQKKVMTIS